MTLVKTNSTMPAGKKGWEIWGRNKRNEMVKLGEYPRLSLGEKLMKAYKEFHQVDTTQQEITFTCDARSASGELYFKVTFEVACKVRSDRADEVIGVKNPITAFVEKDLIRDAQEISEKYDADEDRAFQDELKSFLDPRRGGGVLNGPIELLRVTIRAHVPDEIKSRGELVSILRDLPGRIAMAEARGETEEAKRLRSARAALSEADRVRRDDTLGAAAQAQQFENIIREAEENADPNSDYVKLLRMEQRNMLKTSGVHSTGAIDADAANEGIGHDDDDDEDADDQN